MKEPVYQCTCDKDPEKCVLPEGHDHITHWYTYLKRNSKGYLYCGVTTDLKRRLYEHNHIRSKASKALWSFRPATLSWWRREKDKSAAYKAEARIKKLSHAKKLELVHNKGGPCAHPGCMSHVTHPCEGCGRQW